MEVNERDLLELRLAEQALYRQSLEDKDARLRELEAEARYLRRLLNEMLAVPRPQPQPLPQAAPARAGGDIPRRWRA